MLLLSAFTEIWPFLVPFLSALLAGLVGYVMARLSRAATETAKEREAATAERLAWRKARLEAEKANADAIAVERSERIQWQLKREAEGALVAGILEENAEAQKILASIAATTRHLEGGQGRLDSELRELRHHLAAMQTQLVSLAATHHAKS